MKQQLILDEERGEDTATLVESQPPQAIAVNPLTLLQAAVDKGMSPEQLRSLVDLHEQWRAARAREAFAAALNACQAELPTIVRDAENTQTHSRYVRLETITHRAKPIYTSHGFALSFSEDDSTKEGFKRIVCDIIHREGHSERRWVDLPVDGIGPKGNPVGGMNAVQGCISTGSYGQRVLTCRIFNITIADTDLDGQTLHDNPEASADSPQVQTRNNRQAAPQAVTKEQCAGLLADWRARNTEPSGDVEAWNKRFYAWVQKVCGRNFDPKKSTNWTDADYNACDRALTV